MMDVMVSIRDELAEESEESEEQEEEEENELSQQSNKFFGLESDSEDTDSVRYNGTVSQSSDRQTESPTESEQDRTSLNPDRIAELSDLIRRQMQNQAANEREPPNFPQKSVAQDSPIQDQALNARLKQIFGSTENTPGVRSVGASSRGKDIVASDTPLNFSSTLEQKH